jgi:peroxiredoxin Q/BCP
LELGAVAPPFTLLDDSGKAVSLSDFASAKVIIFFYPAAMTPGCTLEAIDFNDTLPDFAKAGYHILGVSPDLPERQAEFKAEHDLSFPLLSDPDKAVAKAWGVWGSKVLYGKRVEGILRSTFAVEVAASGEATVLLAKYQVRASGHVSRLRAELGIG